MTGSSDRNDEDDGGLSRRRLLFGVAAAGGVGAVGGAGTHALLRDTEPIPGDILGNPYVGSRLRLELACGDRVENCRSDDGEVTFAIADIDPPAEGATELCLHVRDTAALVWLRSSSPVTAELGDELRVTLAYGDGTVVTGPGGDPIADWPLNDVLGAFESGGRLAGPASGAAFRPGDGRCLRVGWSLDDDGGSVAGQSVAVTLQFAAVQLLADAEPRNPWGGGANE